MKRTDVAELPWIREAVPGASRRLARLLDHAVQTADLPASDLFSLHDFLMAVPAAARDSLGTLVVPLFLALDEGSLAIDLGPERLQGRLADLVPGIDFGTWIGSALTDLGSGALAAVLATTQGDDVPTTVPLVVWQRGGRRFLYFQKYLKAERDFDRLLRDRLKAPAAPVDAARLRAILDEVLARQPLHAAGRPLVLDRDQLTALGLALLSKDVVVSGGPGTGKTSIVLSLLRALVRCGLAPERIALAAPTGRAAQRLSDALRAGLATLGADLAAADRSLMSLQPPVTLHALLDYQPTRNLFRRHEENTIPADLVLVDEVSMISIEHMASLFAQLEPRTRLVLLGDKDQLPSVDAGAVLAQLVTGLDAPAFSAETCARLRAMNPGLAELDPASDHWLRDAVVFLRTNHRSHAEIQSAARAINLQDTGLVERLPVMGSPADPALWERPPLAGGCWWWPQKQATPLELRLMVQRWAENTYLTPLADGLTFLRLISAPPRGDLDDPATHAWLVKLFAALDRARLLTLVRDGPWGCDQINQALAEWLRRRVESSRTARFFPGLPVLITRNDRTRGLANGDLGLTVALQGREPQVIFARQDRFLAFSPEDLPSHELGFALTVHKSQGSEYAQMLLVLPPSGGRRLLSRELLYTAVTRARHLAVICATADALRQALARRIVRESGLTSMAGRER